MKRSASPGDCPVPPDTGPPSLPTTSSTTLPGTDPRTAQRDRVARMHLPTVLRAARRRRGLSIRAAAARCGIPHTTWADWEAGRSAPTTARLEGALRELSLDLQLVSRVVQEPPGEAAVAAHLRRSLTQRARQALGEQLAPTLTAAAQCARQLTGPAAVGVWVPHVVARGRLPLPRVGPSPSLVALRLDDGSPAARYARVAVEPPDVLVAEGLAERYPQLLTSARLMADRGRDAVGRRLPPHREPDEEREVRDLSCVLTWAGLGRLPIEAADSRAWRLGAPATLDEALLRNRLPLRNSSRRPGPAR